MCIATAINKIKTVTARADEFIQVNAPLLLPDHRSKLVDLCTVALMGYEDHVFHWDQLKNIVIERLALHERGEIPWYLDIDRSDCKVVAFRHEDGRVLTFDVGQLLLSALISVN